MSEACFHCDLPIPAGSNYSYQVLNQAAHFCCPGCLAVAEMICSNQLESFYQFRSQPNAKAEIPLPQELQELEALDDPQILESISQTQDGKTLVELGIEGISCAACGWLIKKQLGQNPNLTSLELNLTSRRALIQLSKNGSLAQVIKELKQLGYHAYPFSEDSQQKAIQREDKAFMKRLAIAAIAMMQVMMYATGLYLGQFQDMNASDAYFLHAVSGLLATPVVFYSALPFYSSAWQALKRGHLGINLPVSIALLSAYFASLYSLINQGHVFYFDSVVMFSFFLLTGRFFEHRVRLKALFKQQNFNQLMPLSATRILADGTHASIPVNQITEGEKLIIFGGSVLPVDGILLDNKAELNESVLTGEFIPVNKVFQEKLLSGSTNNGASFKMQATSQVNNSRLWQLMQLQKNGDNINNSPMTQADRWSQWYLIGLFLICALCGAYWWFVDPSQVFTIVLSLLVVTCPCALSLATPTAIASAIAELTDSGLMIRNKEALTQLAKVDEIFFDKTGTLTSAKMQLLDSFLLESIENKQTTKLSQADVISLAANLESLCNHPVAEAFKTLNRPKLTLTQHRQIPSCGISAMWQGDLYRLGKLGFVSDSSEDTIYPPEYTQKANQLTVWLSKNHIPIALFCLSDQINPSASHALKRLNALDIQLNMLSGDSAAACKTIAESLNINNIQHSASPQEKLVIIQKKLDSKNGERAKLMVGDGVNDIGALAAADVSISMGSACDLSKTSSDLVLVSNDLIAIPKAIRLSKKLNRVIQQNLSWAIAYNLTAIPFAAAGLVPPWLAAIGMAASSLVVMLNALRLRYIDCS